MKEPNYLPDGMDENENEMEFDSSPDNAAPARTMIPWVRWALRIMTIFHLLMFVYLFIVLNDNQSSSAGLVVISAVLLFLRLLGLILLLAWKKWGFALFTASVCFDFALVVINNLLNDNMFNGFILLAALFVVLNVRKDGISAWEQLD